MNPQVVNAATATTGIFAALCSNYVDGKAADALLTYAVFTLGYATRRFGGRPPRRSNIKGPSI